MVHASTLLDIILMYLCIAAQELQGLVHCTKRPRKLKKPSQGREGVWQPL